MRRTIRRMIDRRSLEATAPAGSPMRQTPVRATERHYTPEEIADMWKLSLKTVSNMFRDCPGVLKYSCPRTPAEKRKRGLYVTLRIPESVMAKFHELRSKGFEAGRADAMEGRGNASAHQETN